MLGHGSCPSCQKPLMYVIGDGIELRMTPNFSKWKTIAYKCPNCNTVISCQIDPTALANQIVEDVVAMLKEKDRRLARY